MCAKKLLLVCGMIFVLFQGTVWCVCEFPRQWWGRWLETGVGELVIRANEISTKGTCYEQHREYFFVENRREHCHQCMMIVRRHSNIIQYQESYCIGREALHSICGQMRVDGFGIVHTLVRNAASPVVCPFQKAFHFTYNNQSGGFCRSPTSYLHQCSTGTMMRLYFRQCKHCMYTSESDVEVECLATWKDGNDHFAYGLFQGPLFTSRTESFRCFIYQKVGSVVYIAVSQDPSCRGIRSPRDGPLIMELTEDVYGWPSARCNFPSWLASTSWVDLANQVAFMFNAPNEAIAVHSQPKTDFAFAHARAILKCLRIVGRQSNDTTTSSGSVVNVTTDVIDTTNVTVLVHVLEKCQSLHRCIKIQRIHRNLLNIYTGINVRDAKELCTDDHFNSGQTQRSLLVSASLPSDSRGDGLRCPARRGRYLALKTTGKCQPELRIGCAQHDQIEIVSQCQSDKSIVQLVCMMSWRESELTFLVARTFDSNETICFQLQRQDNRLSVTVSDQCTFPDNGRYGPMNTIYVFQSTRKNCHDDDNADDDVIDDLSGVQQDVESDVIVAPTWHLSDRTPSKRVEGSSQRLSNRSTFVRSSLTRTRKLITTLTALLIIANCRTITITMTIGLGS